MIEIGIARRLAGIVAGPEPDTGAPLVDGALAARCHELASRYSGLTAGALPAPESVSREEWVEANLRSLAAMVDPVLDRAAGKLTGPVRPFAGLALTAQSGALLGFVSKRVLGQYELLITDPQSPTRLLFVNANIRELAEKLDADRDELAAWIALHEVTHALQFTAVPWLRPYLGGLMEELLSSLETKIDAKAVMKLPSGSDLKRLAAALREGDLVSLTATPRQKELLGRVQSVMSVVEGHAELVMDRAGPELVPSVARMRDGLERRRGSQPAGVRLVMKLIGLELKMRQYAEGRRFCAAVADAGGIEALNRVWESPEMVPSAAELADPQAWLARTAPQA